MSRQYQNAARAVDAVLRNGRSLQAHCASLSRVGKTEYALACETLKFVHVIDSLFEACGISAQTLDVDRGMLYVYAYELFFGKRKIQGGGVVKRRLMEHRGPLEEALAKEMRKRGVAGPEGLLDRRIQEFQQLPVYVRVNRIKDPTGTCVQELERTFGACHTDTHIEDLIVLPPQTKGVAQLELVKTGVLIMQDKASCMPSQILGDAWSGGDVVDACAAPGNKTSHVAAILHQRSRGNKENVGKDGPKVFAFDKSPRRAELLARRMAEAGADSIVRCRNEDFTAVDVHSSLFSNVRAVLVDPSCSGSGVCRNLDRVVDRLQDDSAAGNGQQQQRLEQLRAFQISAVLKAFSFPQATTVVYSTCSIYEEENESVVSEVLKSQEMCSTFDRWHLVAPPRMATWARRGRTANPGGIDISEDDLQKLIRCEPSDGLNGFFVALFQREARAANVSADKIPENDDVVLQENDEGQVDGGSGLLEQSGLRTSRKRRFRRASSSSSPWVPESQRLRLVLGR